MTSKGGSLTAFVCLLTPQSLPGAIADKVQCVAALGQLRAWCSPLARRVARRNRVRLVLV
ncbi:hypothetical protein GHO35_13600 [Pseudomonas helleri]|uniref:hypothetical protein n=1 Tax=Pseudomonas helleri TaxID=1608996 RepID=UPI001296E0A7|nr:hypothetical protein [Pseudomonas helleri]MQU22175.1 hypothetical protein [Pseudomonas helleri]